MNAFELSKNCRETRPFCNSSLPKPLTYQLHGPISRRHVSAWAGNLKSLTTRDLRDQSNGTKNIVVGHERLRLNRSATAPPMFASQCRSEVMPKRQMDRPWAAMRNSRARRMGKPRCHIVIWISVIEMELRVARGSILIGRQRKR